jgi:catechol 2,3-dioxygenase-like lactoylglutathione lyase family enzyme
MSAVSEIRYVAYGVTDFESERTFYRDKWGLREVQADDQRAYFAADGGDELYVVKLRQASEKRVDVISFAAPDRAAINQLFERVQAAKCRIIFPPRALDQFGGGYGFRFFSPDGLSFEISSDVQRGTVRPIAARAAIPEKISHIVLHSPNHKAMTDFFINVLGFKLSDWLGDFMSFLRCNEWHHRIAVLPGPACLNHVAYDMPSVDEMLRGVGKLKRLQTEILWGPGRHTAGNNTFSYFATPNGFLIEYTAELERVTDDWKATVHPPTASNMDQWGIGTGGPQSFPHPEPDKGLFQVAEGS